MDTVKMPVIQRVRREKESLKFLKEMKNIRKSLNKLRQNKNVKVKKYENPDTRYNKRR